MTLVEDFRNGEERGYMKTPEARQNLAHRVSGGERIRFDLSSAGAALSVDS